MFDNQFIEPDQILPGDKAVDIVELSAQPYADKRRVRVVFRLSSFQTPPNVSATLCNEAGEELAAIKIVNIFNTENEITLHIPATKNQPGKYSVNLETFSITEEEKTDEEGPQVVLAESVSRSLTCSFILP